MSTVRRGRPLMRARPLANPVRNISTSDAFPLRSASLASAGVERRSSIFGGTGSAPPRVRVNRFPWRPRSATAVLAHCRGPVGFGTNPSAFVQDNIPAG